MALIVKIYNKAVQSSFYTEYWKGTAGLRERLNILIIEMHIWKNYFAGI
jgi:hypothetical protein